MTAKRYSGPAPKILKLGVYNPDYLSAYYNDHPGLAEQSYAEQHHALIGDRAASSDFWTRALGKLGYECADTIANALPLQRSWAIEHGVGFDPADYIFAITLAQVLHFAPEILLVADHSTFTAAFLRELRAACPSLRLIVGWCGAPFRDLSVMREWDVALSCIPELVDRFRGAGLTASHVDHAFDPMVLGELPLARDPVAFSFLGSVIDQPGFHRSRAKLLSALLAETPLQLWSKIAVPSPASPLRRALRRVRSGSRWIDPQIAQRAKPPLYGLPMFAKLRDSDVTLNTHIDQSPRNASNMRLFEGCGVGACLLTDSKPDLNRLFEPDFEVVTYASEGEAIEKYCYLAENPAARSEIAAAGQKRVLRDHGFDQRAARIDEIVRGELARR